MLESQNDEFFVEEKRSVLPMVIAGAAALLITALIFAGYTLLRKRHAEDTASQAQASAPRVTQQLPPKALILVDDATIDGGKTTLGGLVRNTSNEKLEGLAIELELKRRKDGGTEKQLIPLQPDHLDPQQEGRYAVQLRAQDYSYAHLTGLKSRPTLAAVPYTAQQGQKRTPERLETKTIVVGKPGSKGGEFLNSPNNPARVP